MSARKATCRPKARTVQDALPKGFVPTPIRQLAPSSIESLPGGLKSAIDEQQTRVWRLRNLIEAVNRASEGGAVEDIEAALSAAVDYADRIHSDLDAGALAERAAVLEAEEAQS